MRSSVLRACGGSVAAIGLVLLGGGTAAAHVTADAPGAAQGSYSVVTFRVPTESVTAATTGLTVVLPNVKNARTEPIPGWSAKIDRNAESEAVAVTWTSDPGAPGVPPGQFQRFVVSLGPLPKQENLSFPAKQTYSDGTVVNWDQPVGADGSEPEHPAPAITLAASGAEGDHHHAASAENTAENTDNTARWIGGIGLALGLLGVALGVGTVLRGRQS